MLSPIFLLHEILGLKQKLITSLGFRSDNSYYILFEQDSGQFEWHIIQVLSQYLCLGQGAAIWPRGGRRQGERGARLTGSKRKMHNTWVASAHVGELLKISSGNKFVPSSEAQHSSCINHSSHLRAWFFFLRPLGHKIYQMKKKK